MIISEEDYIHIMNENNHHIKNLFNIIQETGEILEGNCFYEHLTYNVLPDLLPKQRNLYSVAQSSGDKILEIGFNAGHSALIFLLANPNSFIYCFDICEHKYTRPCFQYLYENFGQRLILIEGNSNNTIPKFTNENEDTLFDLLHIDGSHDLKTANIDFFTSLRIAKHKSIIIWDDVEIPVLTNLWNGYIKDKHIIPLNLLPTPRYAHAFGYVNKPPLKIAVCSLTVGEKYKEITKYGRLTKVNYCKKHNYDFFDDEEDNVDNSRPLAWSKINIIKKYISNYDYVVWIDGDSHIMNQKIKLEQIIRDWSQDKDFTVAQDKQLINTGVILIKNTEWSKKFLDLIYDQVQFKNHSNWEQGAFINLLENNISDSQNHINVLPLYLQNKINSYWFTYNFNDCFILHFPGCWRYNVENNLSLALNDYCPIKMDHETEEIFNKRLHWLEFGKK